MSADTTNLLMGAAAILGPVLPLLLSAVWILASLRKTLHHMHRCQGVQIRALGRLHRRVMRLEMRLMRGGFAGDKAQSHPAEG